MKQPGNMISKYFRILELLFVLKAEARPAAALWLLKLAGLAAALLLPLLTRSLIDTAIGQKNWHAFTWNAAASLAVVFLSFLATAMASWYSTRVFETTGFRLRLRLQKRLERTGILRLQRRSVGQQICLANSDIDNVSHVLVNVLPSAAVVVLEFLLFAVVALRLDARLTLYFSLSFPFIVALELLHARRIRPLQHKLQHLSARVNEQISEFMAGILTFKTFAIERRHTRAYARVLAERLQQSIHKWRVDSIYQGSQWFVQTGWGWAVLFYGFAMVMRDELSLGTLLALKMYFSSLSRPLEEATTIAQSFVVGSVSAERLLEAMKAPCGEEEDTPQPHGAAANPLNRLPEPAAVVLRDISFGYQRNQPVLRNISAVFPSGKIIGVAGPSGAGKSTLLGLIAGLYRPWTGSIHINGADVRTLTHREISSLVGVALQETFLVPGTIYDNITCGTPGMSQADVIKVAQMAAAHDFILGLGAAYRTDVRAVGLSVGQKQRLGIARALAKDSPILILDEPTNALDAGSRTTVLQSLREVARSRLVILISHDPGTLAVCDEVFMISRGSIVRIGSDRPSSYVRFTEYLELKSVYETGGEGLDCLAKVNECETR